MIYRPILQNRAEKLENPRGFWNNACRNTSSLFQDSGAFECAQPQDELHAGSTADIPRANKPRARAQTRPAPSEWRVPAIPRGTAPSSKKSEVFPTGRVVAWPPKGHRRLNASSSRPSGLSPHDSPLAPRARTCQVLLATPQVCDRCTGRKALYRLDRDERQ